MTYSEYYYYNNFSDPQGPSASAYVTYIRSEDALRAIQCVNNVVVDGRTLKVTETDIQGQFLGHKLNQILDNNSQWRNSTECAF
jgi:RNA recognition motif-containing protein